MADIQKTLAQIMKAVNDVKSMEKSLESLKDLKVQADVKTDLKAIRVIERMESNVRSLLKAKQELMKAESEEQELRKNSSEVTEEQQKVYDKAAKKEQQYREKIINTAKAQIESFDRLKAKQLEERELILDRFKQNTILGKGYSALTGKVAEYAAKLTVGALAIKAFNTFTDAAKLRNDIMIASYGKMTDSFGEAVTGTLEYADAIRMSEAYATRLGMANENVGDIFVKFTKIVGKSSPQALDALTKSTLAVSKVMGIDTATAVDFVADRMDTFGGSATEALLSLYELREEIGKYNTSLQGVKIRGDDVVKTVQDITNSSGIYAVDQRYLSTILTRTSAVLQSQGESYKYAQDAASRYTKAISSEAPEWMQITNAFDISKEIKKNTDNAGKLTTDFVTKLNSMKPGLAKKVQDVLDAGYSQYDETRILGDIMQGTDIGLNLMADKIANLGKASISVLVGQYGKSYLEAEEMYKNAVRQKKINDLEKALTGKRDSKEAIEAVSLMKEHLKLSDENIEKIRTDSSYRKAAIANLSEILSKQEASAAIMERQTEIERVLKGYRDANGKQVAGLYEQIAKEKDALLKTAVDDPMRKIIEDKINQLQTEINKSEAEMGKITGAGVAGQTSLLDKITGGVAEFVDSTSWLTGDMVASKFKELASFQNIAIAGLGMIVLRGLNPLQHLDDIIYRSIMRAKIGDGGGLSGGGMSGGGGLGRSIRNANRVRRRVGVLGAAKSVARGAGRSIKRAAGMAKSVLSAPGKLIGSISNLGTIGKIVGLGGALIGAQQAYASEGASGAAKSLAGAGGGLAGSAVGTAIGATLGSVVPVAGTAIGGIVGGMLGDYIGTSLSEGAVATLTSPDKAQGVLMPTPTTPPQTSAENPASTAGMAGEFGKLNPDGSVTLTVNNFMEVFGQASMMAKTQGIRR